MRQGIPAVSVVIPAYNAERTLGSVLAALGAQNPPPHEVIVVDDDSTDDTAVVAERFGARVVRTTHSGFAGGARNRGWAEARGEFIVFLDSDVAPTPGWTEALARALQEFPGAVIGGAWTFTARKPWGWVAHLQIETPYLPRGAPREVPFVSSLCMAVPRDAPLRWDESYGGEDAVFCADALSAGIPIVFDPRVRVVHNHRRETFADLLRQQDRLAYGLARCGPIQKEGLHKRFFSRLPVHYFALVRLVLIYRRVRGDEALRSRFLQLLPRMVVAEWTLGFHAWRYALRRPALRGQEGKGFR